jgi:outer membrane lipoprotein-sorting protein
LGNSVYFARGEEIIMKMWTVAAALLFVGTCGFAQTAETAPAARKSCDDLKAEITKKLEAKGVTSYTLDVVDKGKEGDGKVVGTCDGGTKSIVYSRGAASPAKASDEKKPQ